MDSAEDAMTTGYLNTTAAAPDSKSTLFTAYTIAMQVTTAWIMFSMGSGTRAEVIRDKIKRPVGPVIGLICQFFLLPAMMYGFALALDIEDDISIGMIITASCPGGSISNMLTFWSEGDLDLSITMTSFSTFLAIGFMPLNMFIYVRSWMPVSEIPFVDMVVTTAVVWVFVVVGNIFGRVFPKTVPYITKVGSAFGYLLILGCAAIQAALYPEVFDLSWKVWFAASVTPLLAWSIGFLVPMLFKQDIRERTAIAYEVSAQNMALAIVIVAIAYDDPEQASYYSQFTMLYGTFQATYGVAFCIVYTLLRWYRNRTTPCHQWARKRNESGNIREVQTDLSAGTFDENKTRYHGNSLDFIHPTFLVQPMDKPDTEVAEDQLGNKV